MKNLKYSFIVMQFFILIALFSCTNVQGVKFERQQWVEQTDPLFPSPYRSKMLNDLTVNHKLVGLSYNKLVDLLGIPDFKDISSLSYKIVVDYGKDIDPVYTKDLEFSFSKDSVIESFKVNEWKK